MVAKNTKGDKKETLLVTALLLLFVILSFSSSLHKSPVFDEGIHITAGYNAFTNKDFRINPENGLIPGMLGALPLIFNDNIKKISKKSKWWRICDHWKIAEDFLYHSGNDFKKIFFQARIMMIIIAVSGGIAIYLASKRLWGRAGALISLTLFALSPTTLAHSRFVTSDMVFSIFFFLSTWFFWESLNHLTVLRLFLLSCALAFLALSKMSAILILPILLLIGVIRIFIRNKWRVNIFSHRYLIKNRLHQAAVMIFILLFAGLFSYCVIWSAFDFRYSMLSDEKGQNVLANVWPNLLKKNNLPTTCIGFAKEHKLLPEAYLLGFAYVLQNSDSRMAFLNGKYSPIGWRYFFPLAFVYKTPIPVILLFLFGLGAPMLIFIKRKSRKKKNLMLWYISFPATLMIVYFSVAMMSNLNIGHRHILPIYLPLFVIAGGTSIWIKKYRPPVKFFIVFILLSLLIENIYIYPNYLAYFSPVAGGPSNGYKCLVDSSLDWGQDLEGLKSWIETEKPNNNVYIAYFGSVDLDAYRMFQKRLFCYFEQNHNSLFKLKGGTYCISATMLQMLYYPKYINWNRKREIEYKNYQRQFEILNQATKKTQSLKRVLEKKGLAYWINLCHEYELLRFAKLAALLRKRQPDKMINYTYLIYNLSDNEVDQLMYKNHFNPKSVRK